MIDTDRFQSLYISILLEAEQDVIKETDFQYTIGFHFRGENC